MRRWHRGWRNPRKALPEASRLLPCSARSPTGLLGMVSRRRARSPRPPRPGLAGPGPEAVPCDRATASAHRRLSRNPLLRRCCPHLSGSAGTEPHNQAETGGPGSSPGRAEAEPGPTGTAAGLPEGPCLCGLAAMVIPLPVRRLEGGAVICPVTILRRCYFPEMCPTSHSSPSQR